MSHIRDPKPATLAAQALGWIEPTMRSLVPPVHPSASYERAPDGSYPGGHSYTRDQNPTYDQAEALLAALEGGAEALLFASGMAAATSVFDALEAGDHVVAPELMYFTIRDWLRAFASKRPLELDFVRNGDLSDLRAKLRPGRTRLVWVESPSNPTCAITDIAATVEIAHAAGAMVAADSTSSTPVLCRPLDLGADLVMHSATKQLNGHSDVLAGALVTARETPLWDRIRRERGLRGAVLGPFEAWLLLRGMRTLYLRVPASSCGALRIAEMLAEHKKVLEVFYAGLPAHPGHEIATRQMGGGFGSMLSFRVRGGEAAARAVAANLELFKQATSLGGVESLVEHRASVEGSETQLPADLLRLSIGIEDPEDLVADLTQALGRV
jgi:cystathionine gamma-synthase